MSEKNAGAVGNRALRGCERATRASAILAALAAGAILISSPASALPKLNDQLEVNDVLYDLPSFAVNSCLSGTGPCSVSASVSDSGSATVTGSLDEDENDLVTNDIEAQAVLSFSYEVVGPLGSTAMVPLLFTGGVSLSASPAASTFGTINVFNNAGLVAAIHTCLNDLTCGSETAPTLTNSPFTIEANTVGGIGMEVYGTVAVNLSLGPIASGSFSATTDPILAIDPTFLAANPGYSLTFSPGFVVSSGVPEASTWAMLICGFAGLGYAGWQRGRRATTA
jgi:hypothetical protein